MAFCMLLCLTNLVSAAPEMLAWYQFEQNADDSAGSYHGTVMGPALNYAGGAVTFNQQYAAAPSGGSYVLLPADG